MEPPNKKRNTEKNFPYYQQWLDKLRLLLLPHGTLTDLANHLAKKTNKDMKSIRPMLSKITNGHRQPTPEYLLIIQEWMKNK